MKPKMAQPRRPLPAPVSPVVTEALMHYTRCRLGIPHDPFEALAGITLGGRHG